MRLWSQWKIMWPTVFYAVLWSEKGFIKACPRALVHYLPPPSRLCQVGRRWLVWTAATHKAYPVHISIAKDEEWRFISHVSAKLHYYEILYCKHTHSFSGPFSGTTRVSLYQKGKSIWILLKQETMSGSGISWAICKPASRFRPITLLAPHHSVFYRPDALPAAQPTASKHWRQYPIVKLAELAQRTEQGVTSVNVATNELVWYFGLRPKFSITLCFAY